MIITTRAMASISSNWVSRTEARMLVVRSERTCTFTDFGRLSVSCGSIWRMLSAVSMMLAPGWRWTFITMARCWLAHAPSQLFSAPCSTLATSPRRIGAPF
ncbi:Uncharacterised protein [Klebsiella variicola]|nr:Uncharacterised protein [Klebsiella variicola]